MSSIYLVGGGCRSGKSKFALKLADSIPGPKIMLATAMAHDEEMQDRIRRHKEERAAHWQTLEEPLALAEVVGKISQPSVLLIDCLTLWVSQLMFAQKSQAEILAAGDQLIAALQEGQHSAVLVTNEVGMGLVPEYPLGREFRDLMGWIHQRIAQHADEVYFTAFGISLPMKKLERLSRAESQTHD